jgi:uncharacterized protein (UPF0276 family)
MNRFGLPHLGLGLGLRATHWRALVEQRPPIDWLELITENYLVTEGRAQEVLSELGGHYPLVLHGVALSIGSPDPLDRDYLAKLVALRDRIGARWVSDHLCWTGVHGTNTHDLLPLLYTEEALAHCVRRVREVQDVLGAPLLLENPSTYVELAGSTMAEPEFLARLAEEADCALLLDVNNVYVSAYNHDLDAHAYLAALPMDRVVQIHVAGHSNYGTHVVDTHIGPVIDEVWALFAEAYRRTHASPMLEWDAHIPSLDETWAEAQRARAFVDIPSPARGVSATTPAATASEVRPAARAEVPR